MSVSFDYVKSWQQEIIESLPVKSGKGFKTPQSLGKAIQKLDNNLPKSPTKQRVVVNGLAKQAGLELSPKITHNHGLRINQRFTEENKKLIRLLCKYRCCLYHAWNAWWNDSLGKWDQIKTQEILFNHVFKGSLSYLNSPTLTLL